MQRAHTHASKPKAAQQRTDGRFVKDNAIAFLDFRFDIRTAPAHKIAFRRFRHQSFDLALLFFVQAALRAPLWAIA